MEAQIPYYILVLLLASLSYIYPHRNKWQQDSIGLLCLLIFVVWGGLHGEMGDDWNFYYSTYVNDTWSNILDFIRCPFSTKMMEPGFVTLIMICRTVGLSFQGFILVVALITNILLYRFFIFTKTNIPLSFLLFLCFGGIELEINYLRSFLALLIFLNSLPFIKSYRPIAFLAINIIGISFHVSALIYLPCYFIFYNSIPVRWYASVIVIGFIIYILHIRLATYGVYIIDRCLGFNSPIKPFIIPETDNLPTIPLGAIERTLTAITIVIYKERIETLNKRTLFFVNSFLIYFVFSFFLWDIPIVNNRFALMFIYSYWILWPLLPSLVQIKWIKWSLSVFMFLYCSLRFIGTITNPVFSYQFM